MLATMTQRLLLLAAIVLVVGAVALSITLVTRDGGSDEGLDHFIDIDGVLTQQARDISPSDDAERDDNPGLPGTFVPAPARGHFSYAYSPDRLPTPFCDSVPWSGTVTRQPGAAPTPTPQPEATPPQDCYASNPPTSGQHLGVQANVDLGNGVILPRIPPDPNVYPPDAEIPREAIPHILEHAGVFAGYHCADGDAAC